MKRYGFDGLFISLMVLAVIWLVAAFLIEDKGVTITASFASGTCYASAIVIRKMSRDRD